MNVLVLEDYDENQDVSWGVSFTNHNPELKDYVGCASKEDAFKLQDILSVK